MKIKKAFSVIGTCPYCQQPLELSQLQKQPFRGHLHWYQITPAPSTACPHCGKRVLASVRNSPRLLWLFLLVLIYVCLANISATAMLTRGAWLILWWILMLFLMHYWLRSNRFIANEPSTGVRAEDI